MCRETERTEMKLPFVNRRPTKIQGVDRVMVKEIETSRDGENLKTGGWRCYTVKNLDQKHAKKNRRMLKYVAKVSSSQGYKRSKHHSRIDGYG